MPKTTKAKKKVLKPKTNVTTSKALNKPKAATGKGSANIALG